MWDTNVFLCNAAEVRVWAWMSTWVTASSRSCRSGCSSPGRSSPCTESAESLPPSGSGFRDTTCRLPGRSTTYLNLCDAAHRLFYCSWFTASICIFTSTTSVWTFVAQTHKDLQVSRAATSVTLLIISTINPFIVGKKIKTTHHKFQDP